MNKINHNWYFYWAGCILGGLILGLLIGKIVSGSVGARRGSPVPYESPIRSSESSSPIRRDLPVTILFTGDVMLGRSVNEKIASTGDTSWPFKYVKDVMESASITYINLENPLISNCPITNTGMIFCGDKRNVSGLVGSGVDVASVANNHTLNYGQSGLAETVSILESNNILAAGNNGKVSLTRGGNVFTFFSFNDIGADAMKNIEVYQKQSNEIVIMTFHWGNEYQSSPSARQVTLAHLAIDSGADVVIGAHPHWVQTHETYKDKLIYYSLGNFVFDQEWSAETKKGLAVRLTYLGSDLVKTEELPVLIQNYGQPHWQ